MIDQVILNELKLYLSDIDIIYSYIKNTQHNNTRIQVLNCVKQAMIEMIDLEYNYIVNILNKNKNDYNSIKIDRMILLLENDKYMKFINLLGKNYVNEIMNETCNFISSKAKINQIYPDLNNNIKQHYIKYVDVKVKQLIMEHKNIDDIYKYFLNLKNIKSFIYQLGIYMYKTNKFNIYDKKKIVNDKINVIINLSHKIIITIMDDALSNLSINNIRNECIKRLDQNIDIINKQINTMKILNLNNEINYIDIDYSLFEELYHKNDFYPILYVNGNVIEPYQRTKSLSSYEKLARYYANNMSLHIKDKMQQRRKYWQNLNIDLKYDNEVVNDFLNTHAAKAIYNTKLNLIIIIAVNSNIKNDVLKEFRLNYPNVKIYSVNKEKNKLIYEFE